MIDRHSYQQGSFRSSVAKPPAGSSLLFGALADSGRIKERKNGSYRMVLKDVDWINWFTDRPYRSEGIWSARKLVRGWRQLFGKIQPNAQATYKQTSIDQLLTFEMYKPVLVRNGELMHFRIKPISARGKKIVSSAKNSPLKKVSLFIDDATASYAEDAGWEPGVNGWEPGDAGWKPGDAGWKPGDAGWEPGDAGWEPGDIFETYYTPNSLSKIRGKGNWKGVLALAHLPGVNMSKSVFKGGSMFHAHLKNANLEKAQFHNTDMTGVDLSDANLQYTEFFSTDMTGADLSDSDVNFGVFDTVNLTGANLLGASGSDVVFVDVIWSNTTCPDGTNSDTNANCGFY